MEDNFEGTETIEAISLDMSSSNARDINLTPWAFAKMEKLRLLKFYVSNVRDNRGNKVHVPGEGFEYVFNELKYLHWYGFPLKSLQPNFQLESLVILEMPNSNVEELWSGFMQLVNLKRIDLRESQQLIKFPDLSGTPNLESLILKECTSLSEIPSSIQHLTKMESLYLGGCVSLTSIPNCSGLKSLKELDLRDCSKLKRLPELPNNLETLGLSGCKSLVEIPSFFKYLSKLQSLDLCGCQSLMSILDLRGWKSLEYLGVLWCLMLPKVPNSIEILDLIDTVIEAPSFEDHDSLDSLYLNNSSMLKSLPSSICKLKYLETLCLFDCSNIDKLPEIPPSISCLKRLDSLNFSGCKGENAVCLILPPNLLGLDNLRELHLSDCGITELPDNLGRLTSLETLYLDRNHFQSIPGSIINLSKLRFLDISNCERIKVLPKLRYWTSISAVNCTSLEELSYPSFHNSSFYYDMEANFTNCFKLNRASLNYFLEGTVLEMQGRATSIVKRHLQVNAAQSPPSPLASICYPENDIPKWFSFRSTRSFIDVKLPQHCFNYDFICLALSVVVTISDPNHQCDHQEDDYHEYSNVNYEGIVKSKDGDRCLNRIDESEDDFYSLFEVPYCGPDYIKSNHMIIGFGYYFVSELCDDEFSFQFSVKNRNESNIEHIKVVKCGVHLTFGLNLETLGDEPYPKRLKHIK
ncbi:hypothetical protein EZV62_003446 [Acer yangbiense]|uniref:Uncharacterized protein n=1 Tax=Acer yangbiense TaxID=1000413 RepID=A0A5C7IH85_9ROSI|nr:hypothetical protein EZV62_003446 [Acer yangbiense]